jgi:hypothetical protein
VEIRSDFATHAIQFSLELRGSGRVVQLLQLRVLGFGLFVNVNVGVGVFPESQAIFVCGERSFAGRIGIRVPESSLPAEHLPESHQDTLKAPVQRFQTMALWFENFLELSGRSRAVQTPDTPLRERGWTYTSPHDFTGTGTATDGGFRTATS